MIIERFTVAITATVLTPESVEAGDVDRYEEVENHETTYTLDEVLYRLRCLDITGDVEGGIQDWFESVDPVSDRAYWELGEDKRYSAHLKRNGRPLSDRNHERIRRLLRA